MNLITLLLSLIISLLFVQAQPQEQATDEQIKKNASSMLGSVHEFMANNNGRLPSGTEFEQLVISGNNKDPVSGNLYTSENYFPGQDCEGVRKTRNVSVRIKLSDGSQYCVD